VSIYGHVIDLIDQLKQVDDLISKEKSAFERTFERKDLMIWQ
jgi:hypothetical protein